MIVDAIKTVVRGNDLSTQEAQTVMDEIMEGQASPVQVAALLTALRMKKEAVPEITGFAASMRAHCLAIKPKAKDLVDTCGTGGDLSNTINISTLAALVAAGAGAIVAKHGNRSVSSQCGSADVLEALGVNISLTPEQSQACIDKLGIGFMFAPAFHPAMKHVGPVRRELGFRTVFNILGPLSNPAGAPYQVLGVYDENLLRPVAQVLRNLGCKRALIVHGLDGVDEISITGKTRVTEIKRDGRITTYTLAPEDLEIQSSSLTSIMGGNVSENARIAYDILSGREMAGPRVDVVVLNAAAVLWVAGKAENFKEGIAQARQALSNGAALSKLEALKTETQKFAASSKIKKPAPSKSQSTKRVLAKRSSAKKRK